MKQHQELKAKIDGRSKAIQQCADLGKILIAAGNPASEEVRLTNRVQHIRMTIRNATKEYIKTIQLLDYDVTICCCAHNCILSITTD